MKTHAIEIKDLTKKFGQFRAVDQVSFNVKNGELFGLLGPNGAGKTTIIKVLSTLLALTFGRAQVAGFDVLTQKDEVRGSIGIVFQDPALDDRLTGKENLDFHSMMYGLGKALRTKRIKEVLELVELTNKAGILVENYSGGMKRRLEIARGFIHRPKVLFLDEPTLGLDSQTRRHIWDYIKKLNKKEKITIILTTHYMEEADYLCHRVAIMDFGKIVVQGTPKSLKNSLGGDVVSLEVPDGAGADFEASLKNYQWVKAVNEHDGFIDLKVENAERFLPKIISTAQKMGMKIESASLHKPSLEDVFLHFTGKTIREREASQGDKMRERVRRRMRR